MHPALTPAALRTLIAAGALFALPLNGATAAPVDPARPSAPDTPLPETYGLVDVWPPQIPTGPLLFHPTGIAVDASGRVVVVEAGNGRVTRARTTGEGFFPNTPPVPFRQPRNTPCELSAPED